MNPLACIVLVFGLALSACDSASTQVAGGTSSETQSSLQAFADNVRQPITTPFDSPTASAHAARRTNDTTDPSGGWENMWIQGSFWQVELFPLDSFPGYWNHDSELIWTSCRGGKATDRNGASPVPRAGGFMQAPMSETQLNRAGHLISYQGDYYRDSGFGDMTRGTFLYRDRFPSGYLLEGIAYLKRTSSPNGTMNTISRLELSFGNGRYVFGDSTSVADTATNSSGEITVCQSIRDRQTDTHVGKYCTVRPNWIASPARIHLLDAQGKVVVPRPLSTSMPVDSMGLRHITSKATGDSLHLTLRVEAPVAPNLQRPDNRLITSTGAILHLDSLAVESGRHLFWSIPMTTSGTDTLLIEFQRRYPYGSSNPVATLPTWDSTSDNPWGAVSRIKLTLPRP